MAQQVKKNFHANVGNTQSQEGFNNLDNVKETTITEVPERNSNDALMSEKDLYIQRLEEEKAEQKTQIDLLTKNFEAMQAQLNLVLSQQATQTIKPKQEEPGVIVGCRAIYGDSLATKDDSLSISFQCDEEKEIDAEDLKTLLKESNSRINKKLFEEDEFYFVNPDDYARFKVKKRLDLSPENLTRILLLEPNRMIEEAAKLTNNLNMNNHRTIHNFIFGVVKLLISPNAPLAHWTFESRETLENYLGVEFNNLLASVSALELLGRKKFS